ncbi:DUF222 domain-containing protein, partial [Microbacterium sp. ZW T5_45]|uniref:HNH endonuclease signature motif containing protein n=1 Tax=Microbacterium sp. ZW T5_45 TaxID=3378080 RepID=UPI0038534622
RIGDASWLVDGFPAVWQAQAAGRISSAHARVIIDAGSHLEDDTTRAAYAAAVLPFAEVESPNRLRPIANRIAERFHPRSIDDRHKAARPKRRVWTADADDGMADLHVHAPAVLIHAMMDRLSQMAHRLREENQKAKRDAATAGIPFDADDRTVDEIRADLIAALVLTGTPTGHDTTDTLLTEIRAHNEITVPITTLMNTDLAPTSEEQDNADTTATQPGTDDMDDSMRESQELGSTAHRHSAPGGDDDIEAASPPVHPPALLDGTAPMDTHTARILAGTATGWDRVLTHLHTGAMLAVDRYRPSEQLRRHLRSRDQRCRFPTCGLPARKCDLDHNDDAQFGGPTQDDNLAALCRRHHTLKHASPWHVTQIGGGILEWSSPAGHVYVDRAPVPNTVVFASSPERSAPSTTTGGGLKSQERTPDPTRRASFPPFDLVGSIRPPF